MLILIHSSKTMRQGMTSAAKPTTPQLIHKTITLHAWLQNRSVEQMMQIMKISEKLALQTKHKLDTWTPDGANVLPAIDCFIGDIYSGLQAHTLDDNDRAFAQDHLRILSGLYGVLRPMDGIMPYRFEMGYKTPDLSYKNAYEFWGNAIAQTLPNTDPIINVSSEEYTKAVFPFLKDREIISPRFLTFDRKKNQPTFVVVHAKIARGAYARWLIQHRISKIDQLPNFNELGYRYDKALSTLYQPVYVCREFAGTGLSVRLKND